MAGSALNEKTYAIIDELVRRSPKELDTTPARVALAWVQARPGVDVDHHRRAHRWSSSTTTSPRST